MIKLKNIFFITCFLVFIFFNITFSLEDYNNKKITKVIFKNIINSEEKKIRMALFLTEGATFRTEVAENDINSLFELGFFDDISLEIEINPDNTINLIYTFTEKPFIKEIIIEGNNEFKSDKIKDMIENRENYFYNKYSLDKDAKRIKEEYIKKGYLGTKVIFSVEDENKEKNTIKLYVNIIEGQPLIIKKVDFSNNIFIKTDILKNSLDFIKEPWVLNLKTYNLTREDLEKDLEKIITEANKYGYIDFKVDKIDLKIYLSYETLVKNVKDLIKSYLNESPTDILNTTLNYIKEEKFEDAYNFLSDFFDKNSTKVDEDDKKEYNNDKNNILNTLQMFKNIKTIIDETIPGTIRETKIEKKIILTEKNKEAGYYINFNVNEGNTYLFAGIDIKGNKRLTTKEIKENLTLERGDIFSYSKFEDFIRNTYIEYQTNGFFYCKLTPIEDKDTKKDTIFYTIDIYEGDKVHIENMYIIGNTKTKSFVIDREIRIKEGEVYNFSAIRRSQERLMRTQYFKNVEFEPRIGSEEGLIDIIWKIEEAKTGLFTIGGGYSTLSGLSGFAQISEMNLFGMGYNISLRGELGQNGRSITTSFGSGWIGYIPVSYKFSISYSWNRLFFVPKYDRNHDGYADKIILKDDNNYYFVQENNNDYYYYYDQDRDGSFTTSNGIGDPSYIGLISSPEWPNTNDDLSTERYIDKKTVGFSLGLGYSISEYWGIGLGQSISFGKYYNPKNITVNNLYESSEYRLKTDIEKGNYSIVTKTSFSVGYDSTDEPLIPTKGFIFSPSVSFYGLQGGYNKYTDLSLDIAGYVTLYKIKSARFNIVWANRLGIETIAPLPGKKDPQTYSENKLSFDGIRELRGWGDYVYEDNLKGFGKVSFGSEIRIPIPGTERLLWWAFFFDAGNVSKDPLTLPTDLKKYKYSDGFGLKIEIPMFPIRLYFAERREWENGSLRSKEGLNFLLSISGFF
ncbi:MAG TPA: POTRA domain-containing protein [Spirochaetota bacterium]|nr:POTRA domain-containing protein [Spirochaetota bacterium]